MCHTVSPVHKKIPLIQDVRGIFAPSEYGLGADAKGDGASSALIEDREVIGEGKNQSLKESITHIHPSPVNKLCAGAIHIHARYMY